MEEKKTDKMEQQPLFTRPEGGEEDEVTIDWMALIRRIFAIRRKLYLAAAVGVVAGVIIALSIPKQYTVSVTLSPEMGSGKSGGGLASMAASFLGTSMGSDRPDALNATLAPDIVASTPFLLELFDARVRTADGKVDTTLVAYLDEQSAPWWSYILRAPGMAVGGIKSLLGGDKKELPADFPAGGSIELSEEEAGKLQSLRQSVLANVDKKTSITTLTVTLQDPKVTATVADSLLSTTTDTLLPESKLMANYIKQYEQEEKYTLNVFTPTTPIDGKLFYPPLKGKIIKAYNPKEGHFGIDIQCPRNTAVSAVLDGTIVSAGYTIDYGYVVYIQHSNNYLSVYKYNSGILKNIGDKVSGGEKIAVTGWEDGKSSKQSCVAEFQLWHMGQSLDPEKYITF